MNLTPDVLRAVIYAEEKHRGQLRKYIGTPYIEHPLRVTFDLAWDDYLGYAPETIVPALLVAAPLHDVIEDCGVTAGQLREQFDWDAVAFVEEVTNVSKVLHPTWNRRRRKEYDRDRLAKASPSAKLLKLRDRIDNLEDMDKAPKDFQVVYAFESVLLIEKLVDGGWYHEALGQIALNIAKTFLP